MLSKTLVKFAPLGLAVAAAGVLTGCKRADWGSFDDGGGRGRYAGVGIYSPGAPWTKLAAAPTTASPAAARLVDDQAIIVVTDTQTGEIRACGDLTGYCVGMNPWRTGLAKGQVAPVSLTDHAKPTKAASTADNAAAPAGQ